MWDRGKLPTNLRRGQNPSLCLQLAGLWFRWPAHDCVGPAAPQEAALHAHGTHCKYLLCQGERDKPQSKWTRWLSYAHGCVCMCVSQVPLGVTYTFDLSIWWWFLKPHLFSIFCFLSWSQETSSKWIYIYVSGDGGRYGSEHEFKEQEDLCDSLICLLEAMWSRQITWPLWACLLICKKVVAKEKSFRFMNKWVNK